MAFEKVEKDFVLSDSSVNVYGYKLLTAGYQMEEFAKNPIGYYGHDKSDGVLVRWDNLRVEGDRVLATPTINMEHPRGARTISEIRDGFLNAASVGRNVFVDADLEDNPANPDEPIIVGRVWYNREASLVDAGGNRSALAVDLEDAGGNEIDLSVIKKRLKQKSNMKTVAVKLTPKLVEILNLGDKDTDEAVNEAIENLHGDNVQLKADKDLLQKAQEKAAQDLADEREKIAGDKVKTLLDTALASGKINAQTRSKLEKQFAGKPKDLEDLVNTMPTYTSLADRLNNDSDVPKELNDASWDDLDKSGRLQLVKDKHPGVFAEKYEAKWGKKYGA